MPGILLTRIPLARCVRFAHRPQALEADDDEEESESEDDDEEEDMACNRPLAPLRRLPLLPPPLHPLRAPSASRCCSLRASPQDAPVLNAPATYSPPTQDETEEVEQCPPGTDDALYERILDLRERRLDAEEAVKDVERSLDALRKERDAAAKRVKAAEQSLKAIDAESEELFKDKQQAINEVSVPLALRLRQFKLLEDGNLPKDTSMGLAVARPELKRLRRRIDELSAERTSLKRAQVELRHEAVQLRRGRAVKDSRTKELGEKARELQLLKFGRLVDLKALDDFGSNRQAEDLKEQLRRVERAQAEEFRRAEAQMAVAEDEFMRATMENTACLDAAADLTEASKAIEKSVTVAPGSLFVDAASIRRRETAERDRLVMLVNVQAQEIEGLKSEIMALRFKTAVPGFGGGGATGGRRG